MRFHKNESRNLPEDDFEHDFTIAMSLSGHITGNMMTSMKPTNAKLKERAVFMVRELCSVSAELARESLEKNDWNIKAAVHSFRG